MYRLMIVDDDKMLRKGLVQNVDWSSHGIKVVAEAVNGKDALCKMEEFMPQLIVTDIQMPIMDGLQLTEIISHLYPEVKIILLTAYEEFEYAKRALEYKVSQYVLKYESRETILQAVLCAAEQIEMETERRFLKEKLLAIQQRNFYREICCNKTEIKDIEKQARNLGISLSYGYYGMISFKIESAKTMDETTFLVQTKVWFQAIEEAIGIKCKEAGYEISFFQGKEYLNLIMMNDKSTHKKLAELLEDEMKKLMNQLSIHLYAGMGRWYETIDDIHKSYMEAVKINNFRDVLDREYPKDEYPILEYSPEMFAESAIEELVDKVTGYIDTFYAKKELSLEQIADQVHLSANYVSTLFKKYCGMNISDYIIKVRMEHAVDFLTSTNFKTYEIAEQIGYANSQYFSVLFKKYYGLTPKEYRGQRNKVCSSIKKRRM